MVRLTLKDTILTPKAIYCTSTLFIYVRTNSHTASCIKRRPFLSKVQWAAAKILICKSVFDVIWHLPAPF